MLPEPPPVGVQPFGGWVNMQSGRVQLTPNLQGIVLRGFGGWAKVHPGRVQLAPNLHGTVEV